MSQIFNKKYADLLCSDHGLKDHLDSQKVTNSQLLQATS